MHILEAIENAAPIAAKATAKKIPLETSYPRATRNDRNNQTAAPVTKINPNPANVTNTKRAYFIFHSHSHFQIAESR